MEGNVLKIVIRSRFIRFWRIPYAVIVLPLNNEITVVTVPALFVLVGILILAKFISVFLIVEVLVLFIWL